MGILGNIDHLCHDERKSRDGVRLDLGHGQWLMVRRAGGHNYAYQDTLAKIAVRYAVQIEASRDDLEAMSALNRKMERELAAENLVADWGGFQGPDGESVPCSLEGLLELFERAPDVLKQVQNLADNGEEYRLAVDAKSDHAVDAMGAEA